MNNAGDNDNDNDMGFPMTRKRNAPEPRVTCDHVITCTWGSRTRAGAAWWSAASAALCTARSPRAAPSPPARLEGLSPPCPEDSCLGGVQLGPQINLVHIFGQGGEGEDLKHHLLTVGWLSGGPWSYREKFNNGTGPHQEPEGAVLPVVRGQEGDGSPAAGRGEAAAADALALSPSLLRHSGPSFSHDTTQATLVAPFCRTRASPTRHWGSRRRASPGLRMWRR